MCASVCFCVCARSCVCLFLPSRLSPLCVCGLFVSLFLSLCLCAWTPHLPFSHCTSNLAILSHPGHNRPPRHGPVPLPNGPQHPHGHVSFGSFGDSFALDSMLVDPSLTPSGGARQPVLLLISACTLWMERQGTPLPPFPRNLMTCPLISSLHSTRTRMFPPCLVSPPCDKGL